MMLPSNSTIQIKTVGDLKNYLSQLNESPEQLSKRIPISNMTLRRLLKQDNAKEIPEKYQRLLETDRTGHQAVEYTQGRALSDPKSFDSIVEQLKVDGEKIEQPEEIERQLTEKFKKIKIDVRLKQALRTLAEEAFSSKSAHTASMALGGLLYFLNPADLIPDLIPGFGFVDDFSIATIMIDAIRRVRSA